MVENMAPPMFIILASLFVLSIVASFIIQSKKKGPRNLPPGSLGWPIIGESLEFLRRNREGRPDKFVTDKLRKYDSDVFKTHLMGEPVVVLRGPTGNKFLFSNENKLVTSWWPASIQKLLGVCLVTSVGEDAKQMRKLMSYFMGPDVLHRLYLKTMDFVTRQHIHSRWHDESEVKVLPLVKTYTFELACRLFMSVEDPHQINRLSHLFNVVLKGIISLPINLPGARFRRAMRAAALIREELLGIVKERREALLKSRPSSQGRDLLSHLLLTPDEGGNFMSELHIANNILLLLFAGHDTSSVTITLLIKKLGELPDIYEAVLREQREIAVSKEAGEFLHWDDIHKMKCSWHVVSEVMRLYSPIFGTFREALEDVNYEGYVIPKAGSSTGMLRSRTLMEVSSKTRRASTRQDLKTTGPHLTHMCHLGEARGCAWGKSLLASRYSHFCTMWLRNFVGACSFVMRRLNTTPCPSRSKAFPFVFMLTNNETLTSVQSSLLFVRL